MQQLLSLSKKYFSADWQRSKKPQSEAKRPRRRTDGTLGSVLRSKSKFLRSKGIFFDCFTALSVC